MNAPKGAATKDVSGGGPMSEFFSIEPTKREVTLRRLAATGARCEHYLGLAAMLAGTVDEDRYTAAARAESRKAFAIARGNAALSEQQS